MNLVPLAATGLLIMVALFAIYWLIQFRIGDSGIVDVFWGASVAIVGVFFCVMTPGDSTRRLVGGILISAWAIRLSYYLFIRWKSHDEDARYTALKQKWGSQAQLRMLRFYQMQGIGAFLFALPLLVTGLSSTSFLSSESFWSWLDAVAILIWFVSIIGEAISDRQLHHFRQQPENKGEVCRVGFWNYSRHPNYFFEWLHWWTYVLLAITAPFGWLTILAPIAMWFFLNRVTGIPHTERQAIKSRGDKYRHYQQTTNAFFPWFPKKAQPPGLATND